MNKMMYIFKIVVIFLAIFARYSTGQKQCNQKGMLEFDAKVARLVTVANSGRQLPTKKGEPLKKWCSESDAIINDLESYKGKCFKDLSKQVFGVLIYAVKNALRQYCRKDSKKLTELIEAAPCITKNDPIVSKCYTNVIDGFLGAQNAVHTKKIPHLCCEYANMFQCFEDKLTKAPSCNAKHVDSLGDLIKGIVGNVIDLICGDYVEGSDKCQSLGPAPKKKKSQKRTRSFAIPLLSLLSSFPAV